MNKASAGYFRIIVAVLPLAALALCARALAEEPAGTAPAASQPATGIGAEGTPGARQAPPTQYPRLVPWVDYTGDLSQRAGLTGDWGGLRQQLMDKGLRFNMNLTQTLQGNLGGGVSKRGMYQSGLRYEIDLDTGAAGLWPGGMFHVRGETQYGKNDNGYSGGLLPVNTDALYPVPNASTTCLSEAYYMQFVAPWLGFMVGKVSPRESNVFAHDETTQFMNTAFNFNPVVGMTVPLDALAAGVIFRPTEWFMLTTLILDSEGRANVSGFETAFERGVSVYQQAEFTIKPFDQIGHQRLGWAQSDKGFVAFQQNGRGLISDFIKWKLGQGPKPTLAKEDTDWCMTYDFDQYLYTKPGTKDQGFGLFGRFGFSDGKVNPVQYFYSIGVGGKGMIPGRDNDTFGVGYYYMALSDKMGPILSRLVDDEQGVEMFYNIEITPWMHLTPDLQIVDPGKSRYSDTAVVGGIRLRIDF